MMTDRVSPAASENEHDSVHDASTASRVARAMEMKQRGTGVSQSRGGNTRPIVNFWLDAGLMCLFVTLGVVAVIVQFVFPPGVAARGWTLWGMTYGQWCSIQFGLLCILALAILVHVMLHWTWICSVISRRLFKRSKIPDNGVRTLYGVGLLIVLLNLTALIVAIAGFSIESPGS